MKTVKINAPMYLVAVAYKLHLLLFKGGGDHNELLLNSFA